MRSANLLPVSPMYLSSQSGHFEFRYVFYCKLRSKIGGTRVNNSCFNFFWEQLFKTAFDETFSPVFPLYVRVSYATFAAPSLDRLLWLPQAFTLLFKLRCRSVYTCSNICFTAQWGKLFLYRAMFPRCSNSLVRW